MKNLYNLRAELKSKSNPRKAKLLQGFFKTGKGEYGEGDIFLGLTSEQIKEVAKKHKDLGFKDLEILLKSKIHEERVAALRILTYKFQHTMKHHSMRGTQGVVINHNTCVYEAGADEIFKFYLKNAKRVNNWDLVDLSAPKIVGEYIINDQRQTTNDKQRNLSGKLQATEILYKLARSKNLWERRIAIISTFAFISRNQFGDTLKISEILLKDKHDLIHKAVGWALREVGKKDLAVEEKFLKKHYKTMPRTMLRYAIERFPEKKRQSYLKK